jgi:hypothetical protein
LIRKYNEYGVRFFADFEDIPVDNVIKTSMKELIIEKDTKNQERINRTNYEIMVLQALRDKLRCKEIWVVGAWVNVHKIRAARMSRPLLLVWR